MPAIDPNDRRQPYEQIADYIRSLIKTGQLKPGEKIPSGRELAATFEVAHMTAASAIRLLKEEGLVASWQGRGAFVRDDVSLAVNPQTADPDAAHKAVIGRIEELQHEVQELAGRVKRLEQRRPK